MAIKKCNTKRALFSSVMAMIVCVAMFFGTTYAWFTDSATSGVNRIIAGNLDIEVLHTNAYVTAPETISGHTNLFTDKDGNPMIWEPGAVSYENFTVKNLGTLALKYKLAMNITDYNAINGHTLKEVLKVKVLTGASMLANVTPEAVMALDWNTTDTLDVFNTAGDLLADEADEFQVIVYWQPTSSDNLWNVNNGQNTSDGQPLFIEFGISVVASQLNHESDSFGTDYDRDIVLPDLPVSINKTFQSAPITTTTVADSVALINTSTTTSVATVPADAVNAIITQAIADAADFASIINTVLYLDVATADKTETSVVYDIDLSAVLTYTDTLGNTATQTLADPSLGGQLVVVTLNIGKGLANVTVKHKGVAMAALASAGTNAEGFHYDKNTGDLTIKTSSFSPFEVGYSIEAEAMIGSNIYATLADAIAAATSGDTVVLLRNVTSNTGIVIDKAITLDGNGKTITVTGDNASDSYGILVNSTSAISPTIKNVTLNTTGIERAIRFNGAAGGTVKDTTVSGQAVGIHVKGTGSVTMDNITVTINTIAEKTHHLRTGVLVGAKTTATLNDSTVTVIAGDKTSNTTTWGKGLYVGTNAEGKLIVNNSTVTADFALAIDGSSNATKLNNITINSGTFEGDLGSPSGYSYKEIIINGGTFTPFTINGLNSGFYSKTDIISRLEIFGGTFSTEPAEKFIADGFLSVPNDATAPTSWTVTTEHTAVLNGVGYETIGAAIEAFNNASVEKAYTLIIKNGTYQASDMVIVQKPGQPGKTLYIRAQTPKNVTITPNSDSSTNRIFLISALSNYTGGAVTFEGIKFDLAQVDGSAIYLGGGGSGSQDKFITDIIGGAAHRYTHDITVTNCEFIGNNTENSKLVEAVHQAAAAGVVIENCIAKDLGYLAEGYFQDQGSRVALTIKGCTVTNVKALLNNQGGASTTVVENCTVSAYHDYIIRSNGPTISVKNSSITSTYSGTATGGIIVARGSNSTVTVENCSFTKASVNMYDVYNHNASLTTINSNIQLSAGQGHNFTD